MSGLYFSYVVWFFFFKQKTAYEWRISDWSSDVCSSDLLRERSEDVPALIQYFLRKLSTPETILNFTSSAMERLIHHEWRGNVRELRNVVERAIKIGRASGRERVCQSV